MKIALIGAGPRGLLVLGRLLAWQPESGRDLQIRLYDPEGIGGRVWSRRQPRELIMNTAAQHITLFDDVSVDNAAPGLRGPSLAEWAVGPAAAYLSHRYDGGEFAMEAAALGPNDYASRALYGVYQDWVYAELTRRAPAAVHVHLIQQMVTAVRPAASGFTVTAADTQSYDAVVMALGNSENSLTREQATLTAYAAQHRLFYLPPNLPEEPALGMIEPGNSVIVRGLGLSFFDFVARLTLGRGGRFTGTDRLTYHPSGREPVILAGSRRGVPYHAKGLNQKAPGEQVTPRLLTPGQLASWQRSGVDWATLWAAIQHEVGFTYYSRLLADSPRLAGFQLAYLQAPDAAAATLPVAERLDWAQLANPTPADLAAYLEADADAAARGTATGPLTSALEVLRDLRDPLRQVVIKGLLSDDDYLDHWLREFHGLNDFLAIGPPLRRIRELAALVRAGVVTLLPPGLTVRGTAGYFVAGSAAAAVEYRALALIEARVPSVNAPTAANPLLQQLLHDGLATTYELQLAGERRFASGAIFTDAASRLLTANHQTSGQLFFWGVPTEGHRWLTTTSPRPYVNDTNLHQANRIARAILGLQNRSHEKP